MKAHAMRKIQGMCVGAAVGLLINLGWTMAITPTPRSWVRVLLVATVCVAAGARLMVRLVCPHDWRPLPHDKIGCIHCRQVRHTATAPHQVTE